MISLHTHSCWSMLDGLANIPDLVAKAKEYGMSGLAITDHGSCSSHFKFYEECKKQGINPILGEEFYVANRKMTDKDPKLDKKRFHLTVLAMNMTGLRNLWKLSSLAYTVGHYYRPRIDEETLFKYSEGLIVLSGCHSSKISQYLVGDKDCPQDIERAYQIAKAFKQKFGNRFRLEIQCHGLKGSPKPWREQIKLNKAIIEMGKKLDIKVVLTADSHYINPEDVETHEVLLCIGAQNKYSDPERWSLRDWDLSFPNPSKIKQWLLDEYGSTEYMDNTDEINDMVNIDWQYGAYLIPKFDTGELSEYDYLRQLIYKGFQKKCPEKLKDKVYTDRVKYELGVLNKMGYLGYFLIVQDYVNWAKNQGIGTGPGRGSCCGSLISYLLNITAIDPMDKGMLFERFLNPDRPTCPDIDVDFEDSRREEVIEYVTNKYGKDCVCNILVLGYLKSRSVVKDVARVMELPFDESNKITSLMPPDLNAKHFPLTKCLEEIDEIKTMYNTNPKIKEVFDYSLKLEGKPRHHGVHACGVIIAPQPLTDLIPVETDSNGKVVSQFPPEDLEKLGLLKMDFLGLSTISIIQNTLKYVPEIKSFYDIPIDDKATYDTFCRGESFFCFQFNTNLGRDTCTKMLPRTIMELSDVTAIARPGPMINIPHYQHRKDGTEPVEYNNKYEKQFFGSTYGINVYQEQGMQYLQAAAGFTRGQADFWRKGVAKAKYDILDDLYPKYLEGCAEHGISKEDAEKWWHDQREGGSYTFNLCLSGDTKIVQLCSKGKRNRTISEMYNAIHSTIEYCATNRGWKNYKRFGAFGQPLENHDRQWHQKIMKNYREKGYLFPCQSVFDDNRVHKNYVLSIKQNGVKPVYRMTLEDGKQVKCTSNHKIMTDHGLVKLKDLEVGDNVIVKGKYEVVRQLSGKTHKEYCQNLPKKGQRGFQKIGDQEFNYKTLKRMCNDLQFSCMRCGCKYSSSHEVHHIDGRHSNDSLDNLVWLCNSCHKITHYRKGRTKQFEKGILTETSKIVKIDYVGEEMTYDVEVADPAHNFLVNDGVCVGNSHSYAYAYIGYITCYLLTHYPVQYMAAVMNNVQKDKDKLGECLSVLKRLGINLKTPDITKSTMVFTPDGNDIIYGLGAIKGLGTSAELIIERVKEIQPKTLEDLLLHLEKKILNKTRLYGLAQAGALDGFVDRSVLLDNLELIEKWRDKRLKPPTKTGKVFTDPLVLPPKPKLTYTKAIEIALLEKQAVGDFITFHPLDLWTHGKHQRTESEEFTPDDIAKFREYTGDFHKKFLGMPEVYGLVIEVKQKTSKSGKKFKSITVDLQDRLIGFSDWNNTNQFLTNHIYRLTLAYEHRSPDFHNLLRAEDVTPHVK